MNRRNPQGWTRETRNRGTEQGHGSGGGTANKNPAAGNGSGVFPAGNGALDRIRTYGLLLRRQPLYPLSYEGGTPGNRCVLQGLKKLSRFLPVPGNHFPAPTRREGSYGSFQPAKEP